MSATKRTTRDISLNDACRMYGIDLSERVVHGALIDAQLALKKVVKKYLIKS